MSTYFPTEQEINGSSQISSRDRLFKSRDMAVDKSEYSEILFYFTHFGKEGCSAIKSVSFSEAGGCHADGIVFLSN